MNFRSLLFIVIVLGLRQIAEGQPTGWSTNLSAAWNEATNRQQPVLLYFTAKWCGPCKLMARTTFTNQTVTQTWKQTIRVAVDIDDQPTVAVFNRSADSRRQSPCRCQRKNAAEERLLGSRA